MDDVAEIAKGLSLHARKAIELIGDKDNAGITTHFWQVNWIAVALLMKKGLKLFEGVPGHSSMVRLSPLGLAVRAHLELNT